jgi:phospholipid/cholesterol/gamma-HCH transport system substrate-binding protein
VRRAIRKHLADFVAVFFIFVIALAVAGVILSNQRFYLPAWVPVVGTDFFELEAELATGQAVVPGQGQTVNVAGVKVGEVGEVELRDGRAVVQMLIKDEYKKVYRDATILLRPKTGLKDMYLSLDPGTRAAGRMREGSTVRVANTLPDVNPDEVLSKLDADTRAYLRVLLNSGAEAFSDGPGERQTAAADLRETFKRFEPTARDARAVTEALAKRRTNIRRVIHNFQLLATELGRKDDQIAQLVDSANANFQALAAEESSIRASLRLLPGTLGQTEDTFRKASALAAELGPTLQDLRPFARALGPSLRRLRPFLRQTTPIIRTQLRPFARDVRPTVRDLRAAAEDLAVVTPRLTKTFKVVNKFFNLLAYNPAGSEEGYLFWSSWAAHAGATIFTTQDAHGPVRRGLVLISCPAFTVLDQLKLTNPQLGTLVELLNAPRRSDVCPSSTP